MLGNSAAPRDAAYSAPQHSTLAGKLMQARIMLDEKHARY
jgi:hypothetical protein